MDENYHANTSNLFYCGFYLLRFTRALPTIDVFFVLCIVCYFFVAMYDTKIINQKKMNKKNKPLIVKLLNSDLKSNKTSLKWNGNKDIMWMLKKGTIFQSNDFRMNSRIKIQFSKKLWTFQKLVQFGPILSVLLYTYSTNWLPYHSSQDEIISIFLFEMFLLTY